MSPNEFERSHSIVTPILFLGLAVAIGGNIYESMYRGNLARELDRVQANAQEQVAKLNDTTKGAIAQTQQRVDALKNQIGDSSTADLRQVRSELKRTNMQLADGVDQKRQQLESEVADLRVDTSEKLGRVSGDLENTTADVKRVEGDLNTVSGAVASHSKEIAALRELGERSYCNFVLNKTKTPQKIGGLSLLLKKTDPKHNRYTVEVLADDKKVEKKDKNINEPVQFYLSGSKQAYEIVINQVKKNEVSGFVASPKLKLPRA
jgi:hypothetical protein